MQVSYQKGTFREESQMERILVLGTGTASVIENFKGNVYVPNDLEEIMLQEI